MKEKMFAGAVLTLTILLCIGMPKVLNKLKPKSHGEYPGGRGPLASVNFVTAHDGFTLRDLVSYDHKNNLANGEDNRDGTDDNRSWNHGTDGDVPEGIDAGPLEVLRRRSSRNVLGTLLVSAGTPMLLGGDEMGRSQGGNNNSYCQDSPISWYN